MSTLPTSELIDNGEYFLAWKKIAAEGVDAVAPEGSMPVEAAPAAAPAPAPAAEAAPPAEAGAAPAQGPAVDEGAALTRVITGLISHELRMHLAYLFYAETVRGLGRGDLAEVFQEHAEAEAKDASYLMRRLSMLSPGGAMIPPPPSPEPMEDPEQILSFLIEQEERAIAYLRGLHALVGDDPMSYTLEQMMADEQEHADRLEQFMSRNTTDAIPATTQDAPEEQEPVVDSAVVEAPPAEAAPAAEPAKPKTEEKKPEKKETKTEVKTETKTARAKIADEVTERKDMSAAAQEPVEAYLLRTQAQQIEQHQAELGQARQELAATQQMAAASGMQAEQAQATTQQLQAELEQAHAAAEQATAMTSEAVERAAMAEENAAQQAVAKMDVSMRIQQMRQQLADLAATDPVAEEGLGFGTQAGPGSPQTAVQQQQMAEQAAMMDPTGGTGQAPTGEAAEQQGEAVNAQQEAQKQTAQAQEASTKPASKPESKPGTHVTVKTATDTKIARDFKDRADAMHHAFLYGHDPSTGAIEVSHQGKKTQIGTMKDFKRWGPGASGRRTRDIMSQLMAASEEHGGKLTPEQRQLQQHVETYLNKTAGHVPIGELLFGKTAGVQKVIGDAAHVAGANAVHGGIETIKAHGRELLKNHGSTVKAVAAGAGVGGAVKGVLAARKDSRESRMANALDRLANNSDLERLGGQ